MPDYTKYAYAVSRIRAVEKKMLDNAKMNQMIETETPEDAMKILGEADYEFSFEDIKPYDYEKLLNSEHKKVYNLLKIVAPEPEIFDIFIKKNDYHNLKVILKSEFSDTEPDEFLIDTGTIPVSKLKIMVRDREFTEMPEIMKNAVSECIDTFNRTSDPQILDIILDHAQMKQMRQSVQNYPNKFLKRLIEILIDITNIKTFLRVRKMNKSWDFLKKVLIEGGSIDNAVYIGKIKDTVESFLETIKFSPYSSVFEEGIDDYRNGVKLEKLLDDFILNYIGKAKYITFGIEPLVGYLWAKENEMKNIRIIMVGKINNISKEIIRERLRESYV